MATVLRDPLEQEMQALGRAARAAADALALAPRSAKDQALRAAAAALRAEAARILAANAQDMAAARAKGLCGAMLDRLELNPKPRRGDGAGAGDDRRRSTIPSAPSSPAGRRPNGLDIARVRVPLGVVGIIYESRPNVTADAGALCLKAGNAAILRGGSESFHSSRAIVAALGAGLAAAGLPAAAIQLVPTADRAAVGIMLRMAEHVDVIVPRGGRSLIERVMAESRIPVLAHLEGNCHTYLHRSADPAMAVAIAVNAKLRRTGVCGATETLLVDRDAAERLLPPVLEALIAAGCAIRGDEMVRRARAARRAGHRAGLAHRISRRDPGGEDRGRARRGDRAHQPLRLAPHRLHRRRRRGRRPRASCARSTAPSSSTTPARSSPTAASSAWVRRSASPPAACTRAGRSASSS